MVKVRCVWMMAVDVAWIVGMVRVVGVVCMPQLQSSAASTRQPRTACIDREGNACPIGSCRIDGADTGLVPDRRDVVPSEGNCVPCWRRGRWQWRIQQRWRWR